MISLQKLIQEPKQQALLCRSLVRLRFDSDFKAFMELMELALNKMDRDNRTATSPKLEQGQGAAQILDELLMLIADAETTVRKIEDNQPR